MKRRERLRSERGRKRENLNPRKRKRRARKRNPNEENNNQMMRKTLGPMLLTVAWVGSQKKDQGTNNLSL